MKKEAGKDAVKMSRQQNSMQTNSSVVEVTADDEVVSIDTQIFVHKFDKQPICRHEKLCSTDDCLGRFRI